MHGAKHSKERILQACGRYELHCTHAQCDQHLASAQQFPRNQHLRSIGNNTGTNPEQTSGNTHGGEREARRRHTSGRRRAMMDVWLVGISKTRAHKKTHAVELCNKITFPQKQACAMQVRM
jgi:hypothetical protein